MTYKKTKNNRKREKERNKALDNTSYKLASGFCVILLLLLLLTNSFTKQEPFNA